MHPVPFHLTLVSRCLLTAAFLLFSSSLFPSHAALTNVVNGVTAAFGPNSLASTDVLIVSNGGRANFSDTNMAGFFGTNTSGRLAFVTGNSSINMPESRTSMNGTNNSLVVIDRSSWSNNFWLSMRGVSNTVSFTNSTLNTAFLEIEGKSGQFFFHNSTNRPFGGKLTLSGSNNLLVISGPKSFLIETNPGFTRFGAFNTVGNTSIMTDGAIYWGTAMRVGDSGSNNLMTISGTNTYFRSSGLPNDVGFLVGGQYFSGSVGNALIVSNTALIHASNGASGYGWARNNSAYGTAESNLLVVTDTGTSVITTNDFYVGVIWANDNPPVNPSVLVRRNDLVVSNGGLMVNSNLVINLNRVGQGTVDSNSVLVTGAGTLLSNRQETVVGHSGHHASLTVADGALLHAGNRLVLGMNASSTNNRLTLDGGLAHVTNGSGTAVLDIRRGMVTLASNGVLVTDRLVLTNSQGSLSLHSGTLRSSSTLATNQTVFMVGDGIGAASFVASGGSHLFSNAAGTALQLMSNTSFSVDNARVTNTGHVSVGAGADFFIDVEDVALNGSSFHVQGNLTNAGSMFFTNETGGAQDGMLNGFQGITVTGSFVHSGTVTWSFSAPLASGQGTWTSPYLGALRSTSDIFSSYRNGWLMDESFMLQGLSEDKQITSIYSAGFYYLAVIPEPETDVFLTLSLLILLGGMARRRLTS